MDNFAKFVEFDKFCKDCVHYAEESEITDIYGNKYYADSEACDECLNDCTNKYSKKPTGFKANT